MRANPVNVRRNTLALACFLIALVLASGFMALSVVHSGMATRVASGVSAVMPDGWYFGKAQWKADARTLVAAARFVLIDSVAGPSGPGYAVATNIDMLPAALTIRNSSEVPTV